MSIPQEFVKALVFPKRASELPEADDIFGWMIGSWEVEAVLHDVSGRTQKSKGEVHAAWVLEGRAIQDLFIYPRRADRQSGRPVQGDRYGTTIKTYDPELRTWRCNFINPAADETSAQLTARRIGDTIEMDGTLSNGNPVRCRYEAISPSSFHYTAEKLKSDEHSWYVYLELFGSRSGSQADAA